MSRESHAVLYEALSSYQPGDHPGELQAAAAGHLGASRQPEVLIEEYAEAMERGDHTAAQLIADELAPVSVARRIAAGLLPEATTRAGG